jgi:hypothetical protein
MVRSRKHMKMCCILGILDWKCWSVSGFGDRSLMLEGGYLEMEEIEANACFSGSWLWVALLVEAIANHQCGYVAADAEMQRCLSGQRERDSGAADVETLKGAEAEGTSEWKMVVGDAGRQGPVGDAKSAGVYVCLALELV